MSAIQLGDFEILPEQHCLRKNGQEIHVEPKVMAVLCVLMASPGEVVSRRQLLDTVWAGTVVGEEALTRCISELRSALQDSAAHPCFIGTVPKRGYRLLQTPHVVTEQTSAGPNTSRTGASKRSRWAAAYAAGLVLALAGAVHYLAADSENDPIRIGVMPFTTPEADAHLGHGLAERIIDSLVGVPDLRITSRTYAFALDPQSDPQRLGQELQVDALLTGSLSKTQGKLRASVRLIDVASGFELWAQTFENSTDLFAIQERVASAIIETFNIENPPPLRVPRITADIDALDLYLLGRFHWHKRTPEALARAVNFFSDAIQADPSMAAAYSGLADAYLLQSSYGERTTTDAVALATPPVAQALRLDSASADAHASQGMLALASGDTTRAIAALSRATELNPNHTMALMWLGNAVLDQGDLLLAHTQYERAYRTDPQHPTVINNYAQSLMNLGRYDDVSDLLAGTTEDRAVLRHLQAKLALEKRDWLTVVRLAEALRRDGDVLNADLTMWRLETARGNTSAAESYLDHAAQVDVADHKVFLAVLEHLAGASNSLAFQGILDHWEVVDDSHEYHAKLTFSRGAWQGIGQAARGEYELALRTFSTLLENQPASIEPSFRLMLVGHTLAAAQALGDSQAYSHWRDLGLDWTATAERAGWASFEFRLQQGLFLAAAIEPDAAQSAFLAASELGELPAQQIRNDPRALPLISSGELAEFI